MALNVRQYTVNSNTELTINIPGEGLAIIDANLASFELCFAGGDFTEIQRGFEYHPPGGFDKFCVRNNNLTGLVVKIAVWDGEFVDRRFLINQVQGIEPSTIAEIRDTGYVKDTVQTAVVGEKSIGVLWNPAGSTKTLALQSLSASAPTADRVTLNSITDVTGFTLAANVKSKYLGDPDGVAEVYRHTDATPPALLGDTYDRFRVAADLTYPTAYDPPILIPPENGVAIWLNTVNLELNCRFELLEIDG